MAAKKGAKKAARKTAKKTAKKGGKKKAAKKTAKPKGLKARGTRAQVMHGSARRTGGGLTKSDLRYNKHGRIVSVKVSNAAKKNKFLVKAGYVPKKGVFTLFKKSKK